MTELHQAWGLLERVREIAGARDDEATLSAVACITEANREMLATLKAVKLALPILRDTLSRIGLPLGVSAADDLLDQVNDTIAKAERR